MTLQELYQNYLDMTKHLDDVDVLSFEEYKKSRKYVLDLLAETDAERIIKAEAKRLGE